MQHVAAFDPSFPSAYTISDGASWGEGAGWGGGGGGARLSWTIVLMIRGTPGVNEKIM